VVGSYGEIQVMKLDDALSLIREIPDYPQPGILFRDITPLLANQEAFAIVTESLLSHNGTASHIAGIEARGFILASAMAIKAGAGFVPIRKAGKLPHAVFAESYSLEYGRATLEIHQDAFAHSQKVLLVDDVLATGGTVLAALKLIKRAGGNISQLCVLLEISALGGRSRILSEFPEVDIKALVQV
jgi:adenine phosphoribosyltransferase